MVANIIRGVVNTVESVTARARQANTQAQFQYPSNPAPHNIVFVFKPYTYGGTSGVVRSVSSVSGAVALPLPTNLQDTYSVKIGEYELGASGALVAQGLDSGAVTGQQALEDLNAIGDNLQSSDSTIGNLLSNAQAASRFFGRNFLDALPIGGVGGGVDIGTGTAVNPHIALKFDGVDLKTHNFQWVLSPKNESEAASIRDITRYVRQQMAPSYPVAGPGTAIGRNLLEYPSLVEISFVGVNQDYFYYFKPAMIGNFTVNYAPNGIALNRGGRPAVVTINMTVTEARIHTREDF